MKDLDEILSIEKAYSFLEDAPRKNKELCKRWRPDLSKGFKKSGKHEALADIYESIDELKYYRDCFIKL